jgi:predicted CxxxxCH...CXXCH cytochrome family protein
MRTVIMVRVCVHQILVAGGILLGLVLTGCADVKNNDGPAPVAPGVVVHPAGILDPASPDWHGNLARQHGWDLRLCQTCHGADYHGGTSGASCVGCHNNGGGPENCATCHGTTNPAPPKDLAGHTDRSYPGVGAHQKHISAAEGLCVECHVTPVGTIFDTRHIDVTPGAEIVWGGMTSQRTNVPGTPFYTSSLPTTVPHPAYDGDRCSNTYCHGTFKNGNQANAPHWTDTTPASGACGTCHGLPPVGLHPTDTHCSNCHGEVVDASLRFIHPEKHVNGKLNVYGDEIPF